MLKNIRLAMANKKYNSKIKYNNFDNSLSIEIRYKIVTSRKEEEQLRNYFYRRAKKRGDKVRKKDIRVSPKEGDIVEETTGFGVWLNKEIYAGLERIKRVAPYVFPLLIDDLRKYMEHNREHEKLIEYAINGLEEIVKR